MASTDVLPFPLRGYAYRARVPIVDADGDLVTAAASLDSEVSKDSGTFADCTNEATEIATSSGIYYLDLTSTEMTAASVDVIVKTGTAGAKTTFFTLNPEVLAALATGTAQAGAAGSITLAAGASAVDDAYNGMFVGVTANTGAGQARRVTDYNGTTKVATVVPNWGTNPDNTSTYDLLITPLAVNNVAWLGGAIADTAAAGMPKVNVTQIAGSAVNTSSAQLGVNVVTVAQAGARTVADEVLDRDIAGSASGGARNVRSALRILRNKRAISAGTLTVYQEDDSTSAWTATVATAAGNPISSVDPA